MGIFLWAFMGLLFFVGMCWFFVLGTITLAKAWSVRRQQRAWRRKR